MLSNIRPLEQAYRTISKDSSVLVKPVLIISMLIVSLALSIISTNRYFIILLGVIPAMALGLLIIRWPALGIIGLVIAGILVPFSIGTGTGTNINPTVILILLLCGLWLFEMIAKQRQLHFVSSRTTLPLVVLLLVAMVAFVAGQLPWFVFARQTAPVSAQLGGLAIFILSAAVFFLVGNQVRQVRWLEWLTWIFIILGIFFFLGWLVPPIGSITSHIYQPGAVQSGMFWTWFIAMAFSQVIFNSRLGKGWRMVLLGAVAMTLYVAYFLNGGWKSGYIPPIAAVGAILTFRSWRLGLLVGLIGLFLVPFVISDAIATDEYSYLTRLEAGLIILEIIKVSPLIGFGPANYYFYTPTIPLRGYFASFNSHNQYLDLLAQVGLIGLVVFFWFAFEVGRLGWQLRNRVESGFEQAYVYGVLGGLAGTLVAGLLSDWILPFVYNVGFNGLRASVIAWIFMGGLVSLEAITSQRSQLVSSKSSQSN